MQFAIAAAAPSPLVVPAGIQAALDRAVAAGAAEAASWAATNPNGTPARFDADVIASVTPPPTGAAATADLDAVRAAQVSRTRAGNKLARELASSSARPTWQAAIEEIGRTQGPEQAKRAAALLEAARDRNAEVTDLAKQAHDRRRPYEVDPTITTVVYKPHGNASYPSGHSSGAYASALVLAALIPERAAELRAAADQVAYSRVYGGVHFPSDVAAGARIGARIAADVLRRANATDQASLAA